MRQADTQSPRSGGVRSAAGLALVATVIVIAGLHLAREILIPLALAILLSFLLAPLVKHLQRWRLGRTPAVVLALVFASLVIGVVGWVVYLQLGDLISHLPEHRGKIRERVLAIRERIERSNKDVARIIETVTGAMESKKEAGEETPGPAAPEDLPGHAEATPPGPSGNRDQPIFVETVETAPNLFLRLQQAIGPFLNPLGTAGVVAVFVIFLLLEGEDLRSRLIRIAGKGRLSGTTEAINDAVQRVSRYLLVQSLLNGLYGVVVAVGLLLIGVPGWALWGFLCAAFRFLPYVGPWLGALTPLLLSFATSEGDLWWVEPLGVAGFFAVVELIFNLVLEPWLYGTSTGVTPFGIIAAALFWTWIWGPIGLILATPLTVCLVVLGKHFPQLRYLHVLLGDEETLSPAERYYQRILANDPEGAQAFITTLLRQKPLAEVLDALVPVLVQSELDWAGGDLREEKRESLHESLLEILETIEEGGGPREKEKDKDKEKDNEKEKGEGEVAASPAPPAARLVALPARSEGEGIAAAFLSALARRAGYACDAMSEDLLTGELIEQLEDPGAGAALVVLLPATGLRHTSALLKRIHARLPALKIIVVAWGQEEGLRRWGERLLAHADGVAASGAAALAELERLGFHAPGPEEEAPAERSAP